MADLWRGALSPRRAWTLTEHLPEDSALAAALAGGPEHRGWTLQTHLLAQIVNAVRFADANNVRVSGGKLRRNPDPVKPPQGRPAGRARMLDLSGHPGAMALPDKYIRG
ncbi:hypothetical protein I5Q34_19825 [Streptomyces sp. AV19]|uniref:hypothetical protein n=1 Tax=Streptomyces sp. AV19 TaxID=2793068 RepID=UPI0018FE5325|nr:hypothetical protein [Streptomyces sp. AV19]MBH1936498.1 hypothetical protein [Streptomyces sp. AV19]MDG4532555.1 hypothetical protein [Streptomyces sp. AV19]